MKAVRFKIGYTGAYHCSEPGDMQGEYVPLGEALGALERAEQAEQAEAHVEYLIGLFGRVARNEVQTLGTVNERVQHDVQAIINKRQELTEQRDEADEAELKATAKIAALRAALLESTKRFTILEQLATRDEYNDDRRWKARAEKLLDRGDIAAAAEAHDAKMRRAGMEEAKRIIGGIHAERRDVPIWHEGYGQAIVDTYKAIRAAIAADAGEDA